ncbi:MAG: transcriptional regulator [Caldilineaceae bacterium SB0661_bin_32]|uniref:Transcriptional regulator n=1 Tax=Caldilineaceae bacterium SB0661_bin_32 TaxID=2605255 RepID=A0A6B1D1N3_9CHLR|nr:transcriptional regulator [Caldilineaceae bacterium SB0661_bin_32]
MSDFTDVELLRIIAGGETDRVEFKESLTGSAAERIREAICAFANDLPGHGAPGLIFVGVRDDSTIVGTSATDRLLQQLADMKTDGNILPPPTLTVERIMLQNKEVALVVVQPSNSPPVRCQGSICIRIGPRRGIATAQDERILNEKRRFGDRPFDVTPIPTAGLSDLNLTQFENEYLPAAFSDEILAANDRSLREQLSATKMIESAQRPTATVMGLLAIGKNPQDFLPGAYAQFLRIGGNELADDILDSEDISGAVPDLLRRLDEKLRAHNRTEVDITSGDTDLRTALYPTEALQQITRNAIMHRTYEATNAPVRVSWFSNRIEVISPGGAFGTVAADNFGQPGLTDYRNPNLADAMKTLGYVQRFGVGIDIARRHLAQAGHPPPEFDVSGNHVRVVIYAA